MRKLFIAVIFLLIPSFVFADSIAQIRAVLQSKRSGGGTSFIADANCQGAWYMNCDGDELDRSGNGNTLTETSGDIPTSLTVPIGYSGSSRDFEVGDTENLERADADLVGLDINGADAKLSYCYWFKAESDILYQFIIAKDSSSAGGRQYWAMTEDTGVNTFKFLGVLSADGSNSKTVTTSTTNYAVGTWYHYCFVSNDVDLRVYVNGAIDCSPIAHTTGIVNGGAVFSIGSRPYTGAPFPADGLIDEVIVFDRELSAAEVLEIYTYGIDGTNGGND